MTDIEQIQPLELQLRISIIDSDSNPISDVELHLDNTPEDQSSPVFDEVTQQYVYNIELTNSQKILVFISAKTIPNQKYSN